MVPAPTSADRTGGAGRSVATARLPACWGHTALDIGERSAGSSVEALTGQRFHAGTEGRLALREVLATLPVALLLRQA